MLVLRLPPADTTPTRPPRPSSAPPKQRFDPTEYVRQKREREQQLLASRRSNSVGRGSGSPAPSVRSRGGGDHSGAATPRSRLSDTFSLDRRSDRGSTGGTRSGAGRAGALADVRGSSGSCGVYRQPGGGRGGSSNGGGGYVSDRAGSAGRQQRPGSSSGGSYDVGRPGSAGRQVQRPGSSGSVRDQLGAIYGVFAAARGAGSRPSSRPTSRQRLERDIASGGWLAQMCLIGCQQARSVPSLPLGTLYVVATL